MTISFENDNDVIVYALEKVISHARKTQQIFGAQCVWWLASIIGLEQGLINYIDNIQTRQNVIIRPEELPVIKRSISPAPREIPEESRQDQVLKECEEFLRDSKRQREVTNLKVSGRTNTGRINPLKATKDSLRVSTKNLRKKDRSERKRAAPAKEYHKTVGINEPEIQRRKKEGKCLRCAWPADKKGSHRVKDCVRRIKLDKGIASYPKDKEYQKTEQVH
jgi:hypothetical protein